MEVAAAAVASVLRIFTCESLADPEAAEMSFASSSELDPLTQPECAPLLAQCPELFDAPDDSQPAPNGCSETCRASDDLFCDDGGPGSDTSLCALGTDCLDCGRR
jgi:hypothetical protein